MLTTAAEARGIAGLVIDGGVRDTAAIETHGFPVFSSMVALRGATKQSTGSVGISAHVAGALVELGDWVVGDADGVVVVPAQSLDDVLAAARARVDKEDGYFVTLHARLDNTRLDGSRCRFGHGCRIAGRGPFGSVSGVVDGSCPLDADGEAKTMNGGVVTEWPKRMNFVGGDVDEIALLDLSTFILDRHQATTVEDVVELVGRVGVRVDSTSAHDFELVDQFEKAAVGDLFHLADFTIHQTGTVPLCSTIGASSSMLRTSIPIPTSCSLHWILAGAD